ncbi:MAG: hypothetical protein HY273_16575 [Gammaproteobacteria bacterium]|nr:hypothetical protein [Gammaproteobacteria bacterium]
MFKVKLVLLLSIVLAMTACGDDNNRDANAAVPTGDVTQNASPRYLAYVQKMIAATSDDSEPWNIDTVQVEQSDDSEASDVM